MIPLAIQQTTGLTPQQISDIKLKAFTDYCDYKAKGNLLFFQLMLVNKALKAWVMTQIANGEGNYYSIIAGNRRGRLTAIRKSQAQLLYINSIRAFIYAGFYNRNILNTIHKEVKQIAKKDKTISIGFQTHLN